MSPLLLRLAAAGISPVSQQDARFPRERVRAVFHHRTRAASRDAAGLGWSLPAEQGGFVTGVQSDAPLRVLSAPPSPLQTFRPSFPSPRLVHVILIKRKKGRAEVRGRLQYLVKQCVFF